MCNYLIRMPIGRFLIGMLLAAAIGLTACNQGESVARTEQVLTLPVLKIDTQSITTHQNYAATLQGKVDVQIRPQVNGYLKKIFADEGAYVQAGQSLFQLEDMLYREQLHSKQANQQVALAGLAKAQLELDLLIPLLEGGVVSAMQMQTAKVNLAAAKAALLQSEAEVATARVHVDFALIKAPVSGYLGKIPYRIGNLVSTLAAEPLTQLSDIHQIYAYFSISELDFIQFQQSYAGKTLEQKLRNIPPVRLLLADGNYYKHNGKLDLALGQFDKQTGSITLRASFPNPDYLLRSGATGKVVLAKKYTHSIVIPQSATFEIQDKTFVYVLSDSSKAEKRAIEILGVSGADYLIKSGLKPAERMLLTGLAQLKDGMLVQALPATSQAL